MSETDIDRKKPDLSLVIPVYNEVESLPHLIAEIHESLDPTGWDYEMLFVDDGSKDGSFALLEEMAAADPRIVVVSFRRNYGQTAGFAAGFDHARADTIVTLDADGQNPPADIPNLVNKLNEPDGDWDVVNGWRVNRKDDVVRTIPSKIANGLIARSSGVDLHDRGCSMRAFRREVVDELNLYGEMHRFIPELIANAGFKMTEVPVDHRARALGTSKYGLSRTFRVIMDLMTVTFLRKYGDRPMHLFGMLGLSSGAVGVIISLGLAVYKLLGLAMGGIDGYRANVIDRPLLTLAVLLMILGAQFLMMGLLAELLVRTYYESQNKPVYQVRTVVRAH